MSAGDPDITLNKNVVALAYHYVREHVANKVGTEDNFSDSFTKALDSTKHGSFFHECISN